MNNQEHILSIVARLRDDASKGMVNLEKNVNKLKEATDRQTKTYRENIQVSAARRGELGREANAIKKRIEAGERLAKQTGQESKALQDNRKELARLNKEMEKLSKVSSQSAGAMKRALENTEKAIKGARQEAQKFVASQRQSEEATDRVTAAARKQANAESDVTREYDRRIATLQKQLDLQDHQYSGAANNIRRQIGALKRERDEIQRNSGAWNKVRNSLNRVRSESTRLTGSFSRIRDEVKRLNSDAENSNAAFNRLRVSWGENEQASRKLERRLANLGRTLLGLGIATVIIFANSFTSSLAALGGQAIAVAGSLTYAAGAIGGTFTSALAQAIPMVGIFAAALQRLSVIQDAVGQYDLIEKQAVGQEATSAEDQKNQADAIAEASRGVADAQGEVTDAQRELNRARDEGRRELQDLVDAERAAELAMRGAVLSQAEARRALKDAISEGNIEDIDRARLGVREAGFDVHSARRDLTRARQDRRRVGGNVNNLDSVKAAAEGVKAANDALKDSNRQLADSHEQVAVAANEQSAAESSLEYYLSQLTPAERELYEAFIRIRKRAEEELTPITDIIIRAITRGLGRAEDFIFDSRIVSGFTNLARGMADSMDVLTRSLTSGRSMDFWVEMLAEGRKNLVPMTDILQSMYRIFMNLAEGAAPVFHRLLVLISKEFDSWAKGTRNRKEVTDFFQLGLRHLRAWGRLLGAVVSLWAELMGVSSNSAIRTLDDFTARLTKAERGLEDNEEAAREFFNGTSRAFGYLIDILVSIGGAFVEAFDPDAVKALRDILDRVVIPALTDAFIATGKIAKAVDDLLMLPFVSEFLKWAMQIRIMYGSVALLFGLLMSIMRPIGALITGIGNLYTAIMLAQAGFGTLTLKAKLFIAAMTAATVVALVAGIILLINNLDKLRGAFDSVGDIIKWVIGVAAALGAAFAIAKAIGFATAIGKVSAAFAALRAVMMTHPLFLFAGLVAGVAAAFGLFNMEQEETKTKAIEVRDALREQADALRSLQDLSLEGRGRKQALDSARLQETAALRNLRQVREDPDSTRLQIEQAREQLQSARLETERARRDYKRWDADRRKQIQDARKSSSEAERKAGTRFDEASSEVSDARERLRDLRDDPLTRGESAADRDREIAEAKADLTEALDKQERAQKSLNEANERANKINDRSINLTHDWTKGIDTSQQYTKTFTGIVDDFSGKVMKATRDTKDWGKETDNTTDKEREQGRETKKLDKALGIISGSMRGVAKTSDSMAKTIQDVTNTTLKGFGADPLKFTFSSAKDLAGDIKQGAKNAFAGNKQAGGYIGNPSERTKDDRFIGVAGGEAVATAHHQHDWINPAMAYARSAGVIPFGSMTEMFARDKREHRTASGSGGGRKLHGGHQRGGFIGNFAKGGVAQPAGDPGSEVVQAAYANEVSKFLRKFNMDLTQGYNPSGPSVSAGHNQLGVPPSLDVVPLDGNWDGAFAQGLKWALSQGMQVGYDGQYGTQSWSNHGEGNHAHIDWGGVGKGALAGIGGAGISLLKKMKIGGPDGPIKDLLQIQGDTLVKAANKKLQKVGGKSGMGAGMDVPTGPVQKMAKQMISKMWGMGEWGPFVQLEMAEAGWNPKAVNPSSGAAGLAQALPPSKYPPGAWPYTGPESAKLQLQWMMNYIKERYGTPSKAWAFHQANNWYQKGGQVPEFDNGGIVPGPVGKEIYIKAHGGETVIPTHKPMYQSGGMADIRTAFKDIDAARNPSRKDRKAKNFDRLDYFIDSLEELLRDGGAFDDLTEALEALSTTLSTQLTRWAYKIRKGIVSQIRTNLKIANEELDNLEKVGRQMERESEEIRKLINSTKRRLRRSDDKKEKDKLRAGLNNLRTRMDEAQAALAQNMQDRLAQQQAIFDEAMNRYSQKVGDVDLRMQLAELRAEISGEENPGRLRQLTRDRGRILEREQREIRRALRQARRTGDTERERAMRTALLENKIAIKENTVSLKEINGTLGETFDFNSTSWTMFRRAILNGSGELLPRYANLVPDTSAVPTTPSVGRPAKATIGGTGDHSINGKNSNRELAKMEVNITEPMEVADPIALSNAIAWKMKTLKGV